MRECYIDFMYTMGCSILKGRVRVRVTELVEPVLVL